MTLTLFLIPNDFTFQLTHRQQKASKLCNIWGFLFFEIFSYTNQEIIYEIISIEYFTLVFIIHPDAIAIKHKTLILKIPLLPPHCKFT